MKQDLVYKWKVQICLNFMFKLFFHSVDLKKKDFTVILSTLRVLNVG